MKFFWFRLKTRWYRLWMCKHEKAWFDMIVYGTGAYKPQPKEWYGVSIIADINKALEEEQNGTRNS